MTIPVTAAPDSASENPSEHGELPGDFGMWVFVLGDLLIFSAYFIVYMVKRIRDPDAFLESQRHLSLHIGVLNTIVLLTSSWFVARAAEAMRAGDRRNAIRKVRFCGLTGIVFVAIKIFEWVSEISAGYTFTSSEFFSFYYFFTGIHLAHMLLGLGILAMVDFKLRANTAGATLVEIGATYWHMVDLLWVVILTLLYMMR